MAEFVEADYTEDWSLQAIVTGSSGEFSKMVDVDHDRNSFLEFAGIHQTFDQEFFASFPEVFDMAMDSSDGLEEFYKPFYSLPGQTSSVVKFQELVQEDDVELEKQNQNQESDQSSGNSGAERVASPAAYTPKYKRRKNHHKRVVIQVSAEGLSSDKWAWRKYGQKPIKGSPYPRSYYRCSSSKGCLARKQVEQSCVDPGMFIITYTAEHSHSQPTRRNSLSGTVRQKFPSAKSPNRDNNVKQEKLEEYSSTTHRSPKTLLHFSSTEVDFPQAIKREGHDEAPLLTAKGNDTCDDFETPDMIFNDEFFSGLEDFDDFISEQPMTSSSYTSATKISVRSCS